jgi:rfaE bifunctional protein nucleotidyltransferase chain/domain
MKIIFTNGCFDIFHRGHLELIKYAKSLGGWLIIGLNSDSSIKRIKGTERPINCQQDRAALLKSLKYVDEVKIFNEDTPLKLIEAIRPDIIVKGGDYAPEQVVGSHIAEVKIFRTINGYSTTKIIQSLVDR